MKEKQHSFAEKISTTLARELEVPNLFTDTDIHISASQGLCVCGIEEVTEYTDRRIVFRLKYNKLILDGDGLHMSCCENGMAVVHGALLNFGFSEGGALQC